MCVCVVRSLVCLIQAQPSQPPGRRTMPLASFARRPAPPPYSRTTWGSRMMWGEGSEGFSVFRTIYVRLLPGRWSAQHRKHVKCCKRYQHMSCCVWICHSICANIASNVLSSTHVVKTEQTASSASIRCDIRCFVGFDHWCSAIHWQSQFCKHNVSGSG